MVAIVGVDVVQRELKWTPSLGPRGTGLKV
jgi:hypothetical protein